MSSKSARPSTGRSAKRTAPTRGAGRTKGATTRADTPRERSGTEPLTRRMLRAAFADRGSELLGLCLLLGGLLAGLSIYFDRAGIVGRVVDDAASWTVGLTKLVLPVAMVLLGFAMFRERHEFGEITRRMPVGGVLFLAGLTGLFHLGRGTPGIDDGADALGGAGGLLGLGVGGGLEQTPLAGVKTDPLSHRAEPVLHEGGNFPFRVNSHQRIQRHEEKNWESGQSYRQHKGEVRRSRKPADPGKCVEEKVYHQRSISPRTISREPRMAMTSEIIHPRAISSRQLSAVKAGDLILKRLGVSLPSLAM